MEGLEGGDDDGHFQPLQQDDTEPTEDVNPVALLSTAKGSRSERDLQRMWLWLVKSKHCKPLFTPLADLTIDQRNEVLQQVQVLSLPPNTLLYKQGQIGRSLFVILKGRMDMFHEIGLSSARATGTTGTAGLHIQGHECGQYVGHMSAPTIMGLSALLGQAYLESAVTNHEAAEAHTVVLSIDAALYASHVPRASSKLLSPMQEHVALFRSTALGRTLPQSDLEFVCSWVRPRTLQPGTKLFSFGDRISSSFFLACGNIGLYARHGNLGQAIAVEHLRAPLFFGEGDLLSKLPARITEAVISNDAPAKVLTLPSRMFRLIFENDELPAVAAAVQRWARQRKTWVSLRTDESVSAATEELSSFFVERVQSEVIPCALCDAIGHIPQDCPSLGASPRTETTSPAQPETVPAVMSDLNDSNTSLGRRKKAPPALQSIIETGTSPIASPSPGGSPSKRRMSFNFGDVPPEATKSVVSTKVAAGFRSVLKAVVMFKGLIGRRQNQAGAAQPGQAYAEGDAAATTGAVVNAGPVSVALPSGDRRSSRAVADVRRGSEMLLSGDLPVPTRRVKNKLSPINAKPAPAVTGAATTVSRILATSPRVLRANRSRHHNGSRQKLPHLDTHGTMSAAELQEADPFDVAQKAPVLKAPPSLAEGSLRRTMPSSVSSLSASSPSLPASRQLEALATSPAPAPRFSGPAAIGNAQMRGTTPPAGARRSPAAYDSKALTMSTVLNDMDLVGVGESDDSGSDAGEHESTPGSSLGASESHFTMSPYMYLSEAISHIDEVLGTPADEIKQRQAALPRVGMNRTPTAQFMPRARPIITTTPPGRPGSSSSSGKHRSPVGSRTNLPQPL